MRESGKRSATSGKLADLHPCSQTKAVSTAKQQVPKKAVPAKRPQQISSLSSQVDSCKRVIEDKVASVESCRAARCLQQVSAIAVQGGGTRDCSECRLVAQLSRLGMARKTTFATRKPKGQLVAPPLPPVPPPMPQEASSARLEAAARRALAGSGSSSSLSSSSPDLNDDDVSSLTASEANNNSKPVQDAWSLSSSGEVRESSRESAELTCKQVLVRRLKPVSANFRLPSLRRKVSRPEVAASGQTRRLASRSQRRPAPAPPRGHTLSDWSTSSVDSGAELGGHQSADDLQAAQKGSHTSGLLNTNSADDGKPNLLSDSELFSIEHFMKSHKSSTYVCHCMANLYFTSTRLVNNGRCSKPSSEAWQLSKTGVPVLTFDSGLARNRNRRRLSISLAERGSGFVLWSDIIDHLSNYRAYCARLHGNLDDIEQPESRAGQTGRPLEADTTCDTFHVMYLSTNHRLMVGLSFDDANSARLFLRQVELVTADPANIALTGPKLARPGAKRLSSVSRLAWLIRAGASKARPEPTGSAGCPSAKERGRRARQTLRLAAGEHTWSTLRRTAMQRLRVTMSRRAATSTDNGQADEDNLLEPLKPLVELAQAGSKANSQRAPRKCDISAPCLFQHVTRIDLSNLDSLYSRALVAAAQGARLAPQIAIRPQPPERSSSTRIHSLATQAAPEDAAPTERIESAASSCYSSAGSEKAASKARAPANGKYRIHGQTDHSARISHEPNKVRQVIREIEAQGSAELVEAKRRLMADIAGLAVARVNLTSMTSHL